MEMAKMADTKKIMINLGAVDLGKIDLLVEQGHYPTARILSARRFTRQSYGVGAFNHNLADFERYKAKGEKIKISVVGVYNISSDVPAKLADEVVESIQVYGIFQASDAVKAALTKSGKLK